MLEPVTTVGATKIATEGKSSIIACLRKSVAPARVPVRKAAGPDPVPTIAVAAIHDPMVVPKPAELQETEPPYPERSDSFNLNNSTSDG